MKSSSFLDKIILGVLLMFFCSCNIPFIPDPIDPKLPVYSEIGSGLSGAYVNGAIWKSDLNRGGVFSPSFPPSKINIWKQKDSLTLYFRGDILDKTSTIGFRFKGLGITKIDDLLKLNNKKIQLDLDKNVGYYQVDYKDNDLKGKGQIYFKSAKYYNDSSSTNMVILSGTFGFEITDKQGKTTKISYGRFDYNYSSKANFSVVSALKPN